MRSIDTFRPRYNFAYELFYQDLFERYTESQLRSTPHPTSNSLIWVLWHVARVEDSGVTRFVTGDEQVLITGGWQEKLGIKAAHYGFGSSREEMLEISRTVSVSAVEGYFNAVRHYTLSHLDQLKLNPKRLDEVLSEAEVYQVILVEGVALSHMTEAVEVYTG